LESLQNIKIQALEGNSTTPSFQFTMAIKRYRTVIVQLTQCGTRKDK